MEIFSNARDFVVNNPTFQLKIDQDAVSTNLYRHIAAGAMFDSAERFPPGRCHPGTRQNMIDRITSWITDYDSTDDVLWLYGPAGSGKSALAHSTCELLRQDYPGRYGGSFFFARGSTDRGKSTRLFPTLAYQLAIQYPSLRSEINGALSNDPSLPTKSLDIQLLDLMVHPILKCTDWPSQPPIVIIDGLDECEEDDDFSTQRNIIASISRSLLESKVPLRFMIASRPEYWIRDSFETPPLSQISLPLSLRDDEDADNDIQLYLTENFETIRLENKRLMESVETPWPPTHIVQRFVEEASGQYIYASTVLKFVGKSSRFNHPEKQLRIITTPGPHRASAFSELDRLYATILSAYPRRDTLKRVLGGLLANANSTAIELILGVDPTEYTLILDALSSLVDIKEPEALSEDELLLEPIFGSLTTGQQSVSFCHLSFREFLEDESRSGPFYVDVAKIQDELSRAFFFKIHKNLDNCYETEPHLSFGVGLTAYRSLMFHLTIRSVPYCPVKTLLPLIANLNQRLQEFAVVGQLGYPACFLQDMEWVREMVSETEDKANKSLHPLIEPTILTAIAELRRTVSSARKMGIRLLTLCRDFEVTQTLVYIDMVCTHLGSVHIESLFKIPGNSVSDILDSLQQHRHIVDLDMPMGDQEWSSSLLDLNEDSARGGNEGWLAPAEWTNHRIALTYECLKSMMQNINDDWEHCIPIGQLILIVGNFFDSGDLSDIQTADYFENPFKCTIFELIVDSAAWTSKLPRLLGPWGTFESAICPALCWFNRQLKNQHTISIMEGYDVNLPWKMADTMTNILVHYVLPILTTSYHSKLVVSMPRGKGPSRSVKINVRPLTELSHREPFFREEETIYLPPEHHDLDCITRLEREYFGPIPHFGGKSTYVSGTLSSHWYPHMATFLLNVLVKNLYSQVNTAFIDDDYARIFRDNVCLWHIVDYLPLAYTSQQNLDALRALRYFFPQVIHPWCPPLGFCSSTLQFLKKYKSSMLSSEELGLFKSWLSELEGLEARLLRRVENNVENNVQFQDRERPEWLDDNYHR